MKKIFLFIFALLGLPLNSQETEIGVFVTLSQDWDVGTYMDSRQTLLEIIQSPGYVTAPDLFPGVQAGTFVQTNLWDPFGLRVELITGPAGASRTIRDSSGKDLVRFGYSFWQVRLPAGLTYSPSIGPGKCWVFLGLDPQFRIGDLRVVDRWVGMSSTTFIPFSSSTAFALGAQLSTGYILPFGPGSINFGITLNHNFIEYGGNTSSLAGGLRQLQAGALLGYSLSLQETEK